MTTRTCKIPPPVWKEPDSDRVEVALTLRTITPMFGGSASPREVDDQHPIRAASVRGHLRFWWRATSGARFASAEELFKAESKLWGNTVTPGAVLVRVAIQGAGKRQQCAQFNQNDRGYKSLPDFERINPTDRQDRRTWPPYALQPFQGKSTKANVVEGPSDALLGVEFELVLDLPTEHQKEVEQTLAAWVMLGGIGARTRRGCGSLVLTKGSLPSLSGITDRAAPMLTAIPMSVLQGHPLANALEAWEKAVTTYRDFRQKVHHARDQSTDRQGRPKPGRSRWPEADSIRRIDGNHSQGHSPRSKLDCAFPRADFGLPIIFHFIDSGDPDDTTLEGSADKQTRFASPIITKALAMPDGKFVPMIAVLEAPRVWENGPLVLKPKGTRIDRGNIETVEWPAQPGSGSPIKPGTDIRKAFVEYAKDNGFKEVRL